MGQKISFRRVKRHRANSSPDQSHNKLNMTRKSVDIPDDTRANSSPDQGHNKLNMTRKLVDIPDDTWLEAFKFLTCPQWSQNRDVCCQFNGIIERNISDLPKMIITYADMYYEYNEPTPMYRAQELDKRRLNFCNVIAFDTDMPENQSTQWYENRGYTHNAPLKIPADDLLIANDKWASEKWKSNLNICIHGSEQEIISYSDEENRLPSYRFRNPILFYARLNSGPNRYSTNYLAQFLKFIYHSTSYIKEVKMFAVSQTFIDSIKCNIGNIDNEPRYIRCESFSLKGFQYTYYGGAKNDPKFQLERVAELRTVHFPNLLKWLTRNVRAETLTISFKFDSFLLANFLLDPSGAKECASSKVKIDVSDPVNFLGVLIKKFRASPLIEGDVPTIEFLCPSRDDGTIEFLYPSRDDNIWERTHTKHLGRNFIDQQVDSLGAYALYMISNGQNEMRISLCKSTDHHDYCKIRIYSI